MTDRGTRLNAGIAAIWQKSLPRVREQLAVLERAAIAMLEQSLDPALQREAEREAHKLAGSAGSFGFRESSELARELEQMLGARGQLNPKRASEIVVALYQQLDNEVGDADASATVEPIIVTPSDEPTILLAENDAALAQSLTTALRSHGFRTEHVMSMADARAALQRIEPALVVLELSVGDESGLDLIEHIHQRNASIPIVVVTSRGEFADRVEAARRGARAFLQKPMSAADIASAVFDLHTRLRGQRPTILAVDDDEAVLDLLSVTLRDAGYDVRTLSNPQEFWHVLQDTRPGVLLLDYDMPGATGVDLCKVVRADAQWKALPIIFITSRTDSHTITEAFDSGADDFIGKPIVAAEVVARVRSKIEREQLTRQLTDTDNLTGLANRRKWEEVLLSYQRLSERYDQPLSVAVIDLDDLKHVNDSYGHMAGDEALRAFASVLRSAFRGEDVIGYRGGGQFTVGMYGMQRDDAVHRLGELLEGLTAKPVTTEDGTHIRLTFSAGVAEYGADGRGLVALIAKAEQHLVAAKEEGKARVLGGVAGPQAALDVLLVEDDETLAELLIHGLETRGYRVARLADGQTAAAALLGDQAMRPRVVLLDIDLPSMDGISVLRSWKQAGVLSRTRVIMLTVRSSELEMIETLKLDAFDHIAKPFSLSVLMQRIRRAMQP